MNDKHHSATLSSRIARLSGTSVIVFLWLITFVTSVACILEFGGISRRILDTWYTPFQSLQLYRTDYYGKPLETDPYKSTSVLFLHPYYLFSMPWREADRQKANSDYVNLDESGFRINPNLITASSDRAVLLGGSVAFSKFSSSDLQTISAQLTAKTGIGFVNRNAPGWNSHQELVALAKYSDEYVLSVSFSSSNDLAFSCKGEILDADVIDAPFSFYDLQRIFDASRGRASANIFSTLSLNGAVRLLKRVFHDTARLIRQIDRPIGARQNRVAIDDNSERCKDKDVTPVVDAFLRNELAMSQLSQARGATHILVIQPSYSMHSSSNPDYRSRSDGEIDFRRRAIARLLANPFCAQRCYDFSNLFDTLGGATHIDENTGAAYVPRIFEGDVHMTDLGNELVAQELAKIITRLPLNRHVSSAQPGSN